MNVESYLIAAAYTTLVFLVRLLVLCLTLPLFLMAAFVGLVDGLVRRDVRRFGAGRESGFIYHRAKAALMPLAVLPWVTYLALPVSVNPLLILLPSAALLGVAAVSYTQLRDAAGEFWPGGRPGADAPGRSGALPGRGRTAGTGSAGHRTAARGPEGIRIRRRRAACSRVRSF